MTGNDSNEPEHHTYPTRSPTPTGSALTPTDDQPSTPEPEAHRMSTTPSSDFPDADERARLNAALAANTAESGFWDDDGRPAPWPDDIEDFTLTTRHPEGPCDF